MPNATVRANARILPEATPHADAEIFALAEQCIAADRVWEEAGDLTSLVSEEAAQ
jgi:hypothetical protein